jgi:peptidoglycan/xylan/chitin deacetylase (PgdA/CDA1 family)
MTVTSELAAMLIRSGMDIFGALASPRLSILIFHRVHAQADSIFPLEPDAARFERLMKYVACTYNVMTLGDAIAGLAQGHLPSRALVITFDDGYADNAEIAVPILQRCGLTASFFVSTGFLDGGRMWNDSVIECVRACRHSEIDLGSFGLGRCSLTTPEERRRAIASLLSHIKYLSLSGRENAIATLQQLSDVDRLPTNLMMRSEQVRGIRRAGMEIGAHTVNHPILATLTPAEAEYEIVQGRNQLQSILDVPVDVFAYPNGKPGRDYEYSHVSLLKRLGFRGAVSTAPGVGRAGDDVFQLPRYTPWGNSLAVWAARLLLNQRNTRFEMAMPAQ